MHRYQVIESSRETVCPVSRNLVEINNTTVFTFAFPFAPQFLFVEKVEHSKKCTANQRLNCPYGKKEVM